MPNKPKALQDLPPAVSSEEIERLVMEGFAKNRADWASMKVDLRGAGPQPCDDSAFGSYSDSEE